MKPTSLTTAIIEILDSINNSKIPADRIISFWNKNNRYAGSKDKSFITESIYNILRNKGQIEWWVKYLDCNISARTIIICYYHFTNQDVKNMFNDSKNKYAPCPISSKELKFLEKFQKYNSINHKEMPIHDKLNISEYLYNKFFEFYAEQTPQVLSALNTEANIDIRVNNLKSDTEQVAKELEEQGIETTKLPILSNGLRLNKRFALSSLKTFKNGFFEIQDCGSQIVSKLINAKKGDKIVDFCAGAGGKTLAMADDMKNTGRIIYCDVSEKRLDRASIRLRRGGVNNAEKRLLSSEKDKWIKRRNERFSGGFDKVVVDAPCSGTGTWRRNPDQKWRTDEQTINELCVLQESILKSSSRLVRPGGKLIYITCSLLKDENESQVDKFLDNNKDFHLCDINNTWFDTFEQKNISDDKTLRITAHQNNSDGFFMAILERRI